MKKVLAVVLTGVMALSMLTACGDNESYHDLVKVLNDKGCDFEYSIDNVNEAKAISSRIDQLNEIKKTYDEDWADAEKEEDTDKKLQKENGVKQKLANELANLGFAGSTYDDIEKLITAENAKVGSVKLGDNAKCEEVADEIIKNLTAEQKSGDFGAFIDSSDSKTVVVYVIG